MDERLVDLREQQLDLLERVYEPWMALLQDLRFCNVSRFHVLSTG